jgi:hypothetical protein
MNKCYPDPVFGGPGFEFLVFRWNGKMYDNYKTVTDAVYGKTKKMLAEDLSKPYQQAVK